MLHSADGDCGGEICERISDPYMWAPLGAFWDFRPPHFEGVWVPIYIGPSEWNVGESRGALLKS